MPTFLVGLVFLVSGAVVYAFNQESHGSKLVFGFDHDHKVYGVGETETAVILLGLGAFFTLLGALRWLRDNRSRQQLEEFVATEIPKPEAEPGESAP